MTASFTRTALRVGAGGIVWAVHFAAIYGSTAVACARGAAGLVPWTIAFATLLAVGACVALARSGWRRRDEFESWLAATLATVAVFAILLQAVPVLLVTPCR